MKTFGSTDEILDFAIVREESAAKFYYSFAKRVKRSWMKDVFNAFAKDEEGHKAILVGFKEGQRLKPLDEKILDLKIGDYLVEVDVTPEMDYQEALIVAMKREKASYKLYTNVAQRADDPELRAIGRARRLSSC